MTIQIKCLLILLVFSQTLLGAVQFDAQWKVSLPHPDRFFLVNETDGSVILVTRFATNSPVTEFEQYFAHKFVDDARESRSLILRAESENASLLETGSNTYKGVRYGATSSPVSIASYMHERIWATENTLWHLALISNAKSLDGKPAQQMDQVMETLIAPAKTSFIGSLLPSAYAQENCAPEEKSILQLNKILPFVQKLKDHNRCTELNIHPTVLSKEFGLKIHKATEMNCFEGRAVAIAAIKESFLQSLQTMTEETEKNISELQCKQPVEKEGFFNAISHQFAMERYAKCLTTAGMMAGSSMVAQTLVQTGKGLRSLYNWVRAEKNPIAVVSSILSTKDATFMCLTPEAQMRAVCGFITHVAAFSVKVLVGAGAAKAVMSGVRAASSLASLHKASVASTSGQITGDAIAMKMAVKGSLDQTFKSAHPFVRRVAEGSAEAKKVIDLLRKGSILEKSVDQIDAELLKRGFVKINTCIKLQGKCVKHVNPRTNLEEEAKMVVYVHKSGVAARIKPDGQSNARFRPQPHGSFMLVDPTETKLAEAIKQLKRDPSISERFMNEHLSWERELAKIDMSTGRPLPSAPVRTRVPVALNEAEATRFHDVISNLTHFPLH